jgi:hypothetical protein
MHYPVIYQLSCTIPFFINCHALFLYLSTVMHYPVFYQPSCTIPLFINCHALSRFLSTVMHYPIIYQLSCTTRFFSSVMHYTVFLHLHINSYLHAFRCLLTPSKGNFNPTTVSSQHIQCLCTLYVHCNMTLQKQQIFVASNQNCYVSFKKIHFYEWSWIWFASGFVLMYLP